MDEDIALKRFIEFSEASDLPDICSCFTSLCQQIDIDPHNHNDFYSTFKSKLQQWKCRALWQLLDIRATMPEYCNQTACKGKRVLVIGAGPVGLRVAIEAVLLGAQVDVVEKRSNFSRNNVLHLWPFLIDDLRALGAKKFYGKFCAGAIDHVCIRTVQAILLKISLVLGVKIHFPVTFVDLIEPKATNENWHIRTEPVIPVIANRSYDAILCADGKQHSLKHFHSKEFRAKLAIAITVNFVNSNTDEEVAVEEISGVSFIYNQAFFITLAKQHGIELENIVYYKDDTHYFVMTAKKRSLLTKGVLKKDVSDPRELLSKSNINQTALEQYSKEAAMYSTNGCLQNLQFATNHRGNHDVAIFDFTSLFASEHASMILERKGKRMLLCVAGDTLLEPFWPTGSGLARGFLGAFDAAWMLKGFSEEDKQLIELIEERETIYHLLPSTTPQRLHKKTNSYSINPHTRYPNLNIVVPLADVSHLYNTDTQPPLIRTTDTIPVNTTEPRVMRFHSIGAQDGRKIQPQKRKLEDINPSITPPKVIEVAPKKIPTTPTHPSATPTHPSATPTDSSATPTHPSANESYLMKFARKLFGIKTPKDETLTSKIKKTPEENQRHKKEGNKSPSTSPHKSPKKKRRKSRPDKNPPLLEPQTSTPQLPKEKQTHSKPAGPGVSELARLYESGNMSEDTRRERDKGVTVSKVSVASVIERMEKYKKDGGIDLTDFELELKEYVMVGIEEVDIGLLDNVIDKLVKEKRVISGTERDGDEVDGGIGLVPSIMRPQSSEIIDEVTTGYAAGLAEKGLVKEDTNIVSKLENGQEISDSNGDKDMLLDSDRKRDVTQKDTKSDNDDYNTPEATHTYPERRYTIEERKKKMGLPTEVNNTVKKVNNTVNTIESDQDEKKLFQVSTQLFRSPIRQGSKDDILVKLTTTPTHLQAPPTPGWRKRFGENLTLVLEQFRNEADLHNVKIALQIIHFIYLNIIEDPLEDTYRRIRITSARFIERVWQYKNTQSFFNSCGWMEVNDFLVLPMEQSLELAQEILNRQIEITSMIMHSKHLTHLIQQVTKGEGDTYTDSIVSQGISKANLDCSIKLAREIKATLKVCEESKDSTDHPWISRNEVATMSESAAQAREWWENRTETITKHASNYSLYFQEEELDEINNLAQFGQELRGRVSERVKDIEGLTMVVSSDSYCTTEDEDQEEDDGRHGDDDRCHGDDNGCHGDDDGRHGDDDGYHGEDNHGLRSSGNDNEIVQTASRQARLKWQERDEGHLNDVDPVKVVLPTIEVLTIKDNTSNNNESEPITKWNAAQRASEQLMFNRQQ